MALEWTAQLAFARPAAQRQVVSRLAEWPMPKRRDCPVVIAVAALLLGVVGCSSQRLVANAWLRQQDQDAARVPYT